MNAMIVSSMEVGELCLNALNPRGTSRMEIKCLIAILTLLLYESKTYETFVLLDDVHLMQTQTRTLNDIGLGR